MRCTACGRTYPVVEGVGVLLPPQLSEQHEHQRDYFDAEFSRYEAYSVDRWRKSFNDRIFDALGLTGEAAGPYLDVGVGGSGATVIEAARAGVESVGCDLSVPGVLTAARFAAGEEVGGRASFVVCAAERLPFDDEAFGAASAVAVLEHLDDDSAAAGELARVLRPGGRVWITVPHAYRYMLPLVWPAYWIHDRRIGHKRHYDDARLRRLFAAHGLDHVETQFTGHSVKLVQVGAGIAARRLGRDDTDLWWKLERRDLAARKHRLGALQLSAVFEKPASARRP